MKEEMIQEIACLAHEINRIYCMSLGDYFQPTWALAPAWQKESVIQGVKNVISQVETITPEKSHENWAKMKIMDGWTYGPEKDPAKKTHPCLVPYDELPLEQRIKDELFVTTVRHLAIILSS